jgi:hypothetical protein
MYREIMDDDHITIQTPTFTTPLKLGGIGFRSLAATAPKLYYTSVVAAGKLHPYVLKANTCNPDDVMICERPHNIYACTHTTIATPPPDPPPDEVPSLILHHYMYISDVPHRACK